MTCLTLIKQNKTEKHYNYNGKYAGYISVSMNWTKPVYYAFPFDVKIGRMYASLKMAKDCLVRHCEVTP